MSSTQYHHDNLCGFHVATAEMPHMESVSVGLFLPVGSRHEDASINGVAHFVEHMIFKGTAKRSALDLAMTIEGVGGSINAFTSEDQTCLETRGPAEMLPHFLEVMSDMVWHSQFSSEEIEREREVIAEEIVMYHENPGEHLHDLLSTALWPKHPLGRPITGSEASILGINRDTLSTFTEKHYYTEGLTLAVAGPVRHEKVLQLASTFLPDHSHSKPKFDRLIKPKGVHEVTLSHEQRPIEQTHLALAFHTTGRHSETRHILRMLSLLLGETMSSRLFQELREKRGLCYHIASDFSLYDDTGTFEIHAGLDATRLEESIEAIRDILGDIISQGFSQSELNQAISFASGQARIGLETPQAQMSWLGDSLVSFDKIVDPDKARETLASVTLLELHQLAQTMFVPYNLVVASIGPQTELEMNQHFAGFFPLS